MPCRIYHFPQSFARPEPRRSAMGLIRNSDRIRGLTDTSRRDRLSTPSGGGLINHVTFTMIALPSDSISGRR
jgi:hypothetical protein